jgi:periplasmic mercuric ion binding protein
MKKFVAAIVLCVTFSSPAWAGTEMVTLSVSGMTCAACPITIKNALQKVEGVEKTEVNYDKKEAVVTYDDAKTGVEALTRATEGAGYPSEVKK